MEAPPNEVPVSIAFGALFAIAAITGRSNAKASRWAVAFGMAATPAVAYLAYNRMFGFAFNPIEAVQWITPVLLAFAVLGAIVTIAPRWFSVIALIPAVGFLSRSAFLLYRDPSEAEYIEHAMVAFPGLAPTVAVSIFASIAFVALLFTLDLGSRESTNRPGAAFTLGLTTAGAMIVLINSNWLELMTVAGTIGIAILVWLTSSRLLMGKQGGLVGGPGAAFAAHGSLITLLYFGAFANLTPWEAATLASLAPLAIRVADLPKIRSMNGAARLTIGYGTLLAVLGFAALLATKPFNPTTGQEYVY